MKNNLHQKLLKVFVVISIICVKKKSEEKENDSKVKNYMGSRKYKGRKGKTRYERNNAC